MMTSLDTVVEQITTNTLPEDTLDICNIQANGSPATWEPTETVYHYNDDLFDKLSVALVEKKSLNKLTIMSGDLYHEFECSVEAAKRFGEALKNLQSIDILTISLPDLSSEHALGFLTVLGGETTIKHLVIQFYCDDNEFISELSRLLELDKQYQSISIKGGFNSRTVLNDTTLEQFATIFNDKPYLKKLKIEYLPLGENGVEKLLAHKFDCLEHLTLNLQNLTDNAAILLAQFLIINPNLTSLQLHGFPLTMQNCLQFSLLSLSKIEKLHFSECQIDENCFSWLVDNLFTQLPSLRQLDINSNYFKLNAMSAVISLIINAPVLKSLKLCFCKMGDEHLVALKDTLCNPILCRLEEFLFVDNLKLSKQSHQSIITILRKNENLLPFYSSWEYSTESRKQIEINQYKKIRRAQDAFINAVLTVGQGFFQPNNKIRTLPLEIIFSILSIVGKNTPKMSALAVIWCTQLLFTNIASRQELISEKKYSPQSGVVDGWWSSNYLFDNKELTLFKKRQNLDAYEEPKEVKNRCCVM